jgi:hypothetical protein
MWPTTPREIIQRSPAGSADDVAKAGFHAPIQPIEHLHYFHHPAWMAEFGLQPVPLLQVHERNSVTGSSGLRVGSRAAAVLCIDDFGQRIKCKCKTAGDNEHRTVTRWIYKRPDIVCPKAKNVEAETYLYWVAPCGLILSCLWCKGHYDISKCPLYKTHIPLAAPIPASWEPNLQQYNKHTARQFPNKGTYGGVLCFGQPTANEPCGPWSPPSPIE